jgi:type IV pilus biogenesis/stability protein PilW
VRDPEGIRVEKRCVSAAACVALLVLFMAQGCASQEKKSSAAGDATRYLRLAYVQFERGQTSQALESAHEAVKRDPKSAEAHYFLGVIHTGLSEYPQAMSELKEAIALDPHYTDAHNNLGVVYVELKDYDKAMKEFQASLDDKTYRTPEKVHLNMGNMFVRQGVLSEALRSFQKAVEINPKYLMAYLGAGDVYKKMGKTDLAAQQFKKVIEMAPDSPEAGRARQGLGLAPTAGAGGG